MARLVKTVEGQLVRCNIKTIFEDGSSSIRTISVDDVVEDLRYIENEEVKTVSGRVASIGSSCTKVTPVNLYDPQDYFAKDVVLGKLCIDASEEYQSNLIEVVAREIVEDEGVENVVKMEISADPEVTLEFTYTDGTTVEQSVKVGDVLCDVDIMTSPGKPDIVGDFRVAAFIYVIVKQQVKISGMYLVSLSTGTCIPAQFDNIIRFTEKPVSVVDDDSSLASIANALAEEDEVYAFLDTDVTIPAREDGRITTLLVDEGKKLSVDLSGHNINTQAYAFYVNGGELIIRDTKGTGKITASIPDKAYPVVQVNANGTCTMESGTIDTTGVVLEEGHDNWLYGVVCSGNGIFNMTGGKIVTQDAACISITNGTASGEGASFTISGDAVLSSNDCTAIYLADNKEVNISGNAKINGGVLLRLGDLNVSGKAVINSAPSGTEVYPLGRLVCESGCENHNAAILALTGCYNSELGNDLNIRISEYARVRGNIDNAIDIATLNTKFDQKVTVTANSANIICANDPWNIYSHDQLSEMAIEQGKTLPAEAHSTDLTIKIDGTKVYPEA